jgi:DNA polymerase III alpha subunit (gram-positive type)
MEIYCSTDVETDGPIPGPHSMLSFGSAAFNSYGKQIGTFYRNLETLPGATGAKDTMEFWAKNQSAFDLTRVDPQSPTKAMHQYVEWLKSLPGRPVFVGYPATFDFMFVYHYLMTFVGESPFSFSALDIKSYAMAVLKTEFKETAKRNMPKRWFPDAKHTHHALDDAIEQGLLFMNILKETRK